MPNEKQLIRALVEPTIVLDEMSMQDVEKGTATQVGSPVSPTSFSNQYGGLFPMIQVNSYVFESEQIVSMEIRSVGDRPSATVTIRVMNKSFYTIGYPKDGDLVSIFIRAKSDDLFKPFHNDYEITNVSVSAGGTDGDENSPDTMTISGVLRVPGLDAEKCFSKKGTSFKALLDTAADLNLGFATNEVDTADTQNWICPFDTVSDFLFTVSNSSWKDNNSFYTYFIDTYYYLNFVNMDPLFSDKAEIDDAMVQDLISQDYGRDSKQTKGVSKTILSNLEEISNTPFFVESYALQNYSAAINLSEGYKRYLQSYDALLKEYDSVFVDPNTSPGAEKDKVILKGRSGENFYEQQTKRKWLGALYGNNGENCHEKILFSKIHNYQNNVHLNKMVMNVKLKNLNFNLRRMQVLPLVITIKRDMARKKLNLPQENTDPNKPGQTVEETPFAVDKFYSGYYVIRDIIYHFEKGEFKQECNLIRREWPTPSSVS